MAACSNISQITSHRSWSKTQCQEIHILTTLVKIVKATKTSETVDLYILFQYLKESYENVNSSEGGINEKELLLVLVVIWKFPIEKCCFLLHDVESYFKSHLEWDDLWLRIRHQYERDLRRERGLQMCRKWGGGVYHQVRFSNWLESHRVGWATWLGFNKPPGLFRDSSFFRDLNLSLWAQVQRSIS